MKRLYLAVAAMLAISTGLFFAPQESLAQFVNRITGPGVLDAGGANKSNNDGELATYSATAVGLVPASSATDLSCLIGSATKTVKVTRVVVSGTAGTLVNGQVLLMKHAVAPTAGTPVIGATAPVTVSNLSTQSAATAVPTAWTTNPTLNDMGTISARSITFPTTSSTVTANTSADFSYGGRGGSRAPVLRGVAQYLCVHLNGVSVSSGLISVHFEWTEE